MVLLALHAAAALYMAGVIWFVQVVHYPLLRRVGASGFARYETEHTRRTSPVVAPVMIFELVSGLWLALAPPPGLDSAWLWANAAGLAVIWVSTFALQVPAHRQLAAGFDDEAVTRLVTSNWIRTAVWSGRALLLLVLLLSVLPASPGAPSQGSSPLPN